MARASKGAAVALLLAMVLLGVFPIDVLLPSFPALSAHFATPAADIAFSISLFAIGIALSQLLLGPLSDVIGRKGLLLAGMAVAMLGAAGCALASDYRWFLASRLLQALGCGCFVLSQALVQDLFQGRERERLRILMTTATGVFISLSPLAGTLLQGAVGWRGSFYLFIGLAALVWLKAWVFLPAAPRRAEGPRQNILQAYRRLGGRFDFFAYWLISAIAFACHFSFIVISPLIFMEQLGLSAYQFALTLLLYGAAYLVGGMVAAVLSTRVSAHGQIVGGLSLILLAGLLMLALTGWWGVSTLTILLPMLVCTAGTTLTRPAATSRAMDVFPEQAGASASAGSVLIFIIGGLLSALINLASGSHLAWTLAACLMLSGALGLALNAQLRRGLARTGQAGA